MIPATTFGAADGGILVAVIVLVALGATLALAETGLVRTSKARARALVEQKRPGAKSLAKLIENPEGFLSPVLLLVLICQLVTATLVGVVAGKLFGVLGVVAATVFEIVVIFVFGEAVPKNWAVAHSDRAALLTAPFVAAIINFPPIKLITSLLIGISRIILPARKSDHFESDIMESELLALADVAVEADVIEAEERALMSSIIEFGDTIVREVMAPRPDVIAVSEKEPAGEVLERAIAEGLSRIPVYRGSVDDVVGIAYTRDLILAVRKDGDSQPVGKLARTAHYVPEQKRVAPLLREMQRKQFHLAVVVDEYGGTAGIVTLEDLIEELVGEIADEFDADEPEVEILSDTELRVSARMAVEDVNEVASIDLPTDGWDTIAGLLLHLRGQPLAEGESVGSGDIVLVAERVQGRRIRTVRVIHPPPVADEADEDEP
ncbi:MAG TPA: hemolysin family protein [Acidimicrobiales bacterium]|nr:hemolysin family protein [Acidimicrobiales bacterium]